MEYDVAVVGAGPGGYVAAIRLAQLGFKVVCIDKRKEAGGTCLNVGCIPSKALLQSTEFYWKLEHESSLHGVQVEKKSFDFSVMQQKKEEIVRGFQQGILSLFRKNQIVFLSGSAKFLSPKTLQVAGSEVKAKQIILATGSEPTPLSFLPFDEKQVVSSTGALACSAPPKKLIVIGAGVIGVELGSVYKRLGSEVEFVEFLDRICPNLDSAISKELQNSLTRQGMVFNLSSKVLGADRSDAGVTLRLSQGVVKQADMVLVAIGRKPSTHFLDLEKAGITLNPQGFIPVNGQFQTTVSSIFAIGDVIEGPMLAHKAEEEGLAVAELIAGKIPHVDYMAIPSVVYTYPEVGAVGFTEEEVKKFGLEYRVGSFPFKANSRARCSQEEEGLVKVIVEKTSDRVLGVHIIGPHASELIALGVVALKQKMTATELAEQPYAHPTLTEAIKEAALDAHRRAIHK